MTSPQPPVPLYALVKQCTARPIGAARAAIQVTTTTAASGLAPPLPRYRSNARTPCCLAGKPPASNPLLTYNEVRGDALAPCG